MNDTSKIKKHVLTVLLLSSVLNNTKYKVDFNQLFKIYTVSLQTGFHLHSRWWSLKDQQHMVGFPRKHQETH